MRTRIITVAALAVYVGAIVLANYWIVHGLPFNLSTPTPFGTYSVPVGFMREHHPDDWAAAVAFDESARQFGYVHRSGRPLATAILRPEDAGQLTLECEGMCGI